MTSGRYPGDSLLTIQRDWSMRDLLDAHEILDLFDDVDERAAARHKGEIAELRAARAGGRRR